MRENFMSLHKIKKIIHTSINTINTIFHIFFNEIKTNLSGKDGRRKKN